MGKEVCFVRIENAGLEKPDFFNGLWWVDIAQAYQNLSLRDIC